MKCFWLNFLAIVIVLMTSDFSNQSPLDFSRGNQIESISCIPFWNLEPIKAPSEKCTIKFNYIAQDFIPIVTIALIPVHQPNYLSYLPIFRLYRENSYFLLI